MSHHIGGQLHGDKECPFSGVTNSGRVWRKVPDSDAQSVNRPLSRTRQPCLQCQGYRLPMLTAVSS